MFHRTHLDRASAEHHLGALRLETAEAERIIGEELCRLRWEEADLVSRRNHDTAALSVQEASPLDN